jgi:hypothetical protein
LGRDFEEEIFVALRKLDEQILQIPAPFLFARAFGGALSCDGQDRKTERQREGETER